MQGRFANPFQSFSSALHTTAEDTFDEGGIGFGIGVHGYGGYGRRTTGPGVGQPLMSSGLTNSLQVNTMRQERGVSLKFGGTENYQRHHSTQHQEATDFEVGNKPRKKAGKLYKPFHSSITSSRKDRAQSRQLGQGPVKSNLTQMGRKWKSSAYNQQEHRPQVDQ